MCLSTCRTNVDDDIHVLNTMEISSRKEEIYLASTKWWSDPLKGHTVVSGREGGWYYPSPRQTDEIATLTKIEGGL